MRCDAHARQTGNTSGGFGPDAVVYSASWLGVVQGAAGLPTDTRSSSATGPAPQRSRIYTALAGAGYSEADFLPFW
jgi:hypothetical protein